jgi:DNA-binding Lrp family transcriptional regulator
MTRTGIIRGFSAHIDPVLSGLSTSAYITLTVRQNAWRDLKKRLEAISEIKHMALVGGEFDVILLVRTPDNESLRTVVLDQLQAIPGVLATRTLLIFEDLENLPRRSAAAI